MWGFGLSEGGLLPSGLGGVSSKATAFIFVPSTVVPSWSPRSLWFFQIHRPSAPLCLSRPHFANDEAHVACTLSWLRLLGEHKCVTEAQTTTAATRKGRRNRKEYQCNSNKRLGMRATRDEPCGAPITSIRERRFSRDFHIFDARFSSMIHQRLFARTSPSAMTFSIFVYFVFFNLCVAPPRSGNGCFMPIDDVFLEHNERTRLAVPSIWCESSTINLVQSTL